MEEVELYLNEEQAATLFQAFKIVKEAFPNEKPEVLLDLLELCRKNHLLFVAPQSSIVMGGFRYDPRVKIGDKPMIDLVRDYDIETLKALDLTEGPVLHIVGFIAPKHGFLLFRRFIDALNPWAVSAHREKKGVRRLSVRRNVYWRKS